MVFAAGGKRSESSMGGCGEDVRVGEGLETGMVITRELEETRLLIPSRSKEDRERCMADMSGTGRWTAVNYHS